MTSRSPDALLQLAERLSEGFEALSEEYQLLLSQQRQLDSKLSWAKQQVCLALFFHSLYSYLMKNLLALDLQSLATLTDNLYHLLIHLAPTLCHSLLSETLADPSKVSRCIEAFHSRHSCARPPRFSSRPRKCSTRPATTTRFVDRSDSTK